MARMKYLIPNPHQTKNQRRKHWKWVAAAAVGSLAFVIHPVPPLMTALGLYLAMPDENPILQAGAEGELRAIGAGKKPLPGSLAYLTDHYTIFNNLVIPFKNGTRELDLIVVGPKALFVVEVKHWTGEINGKEKEPVWQQTKWNREGKRTITSVSNPIQQVRGQTFALRKMLETVGYSGWVQDIVVFTHDRVDLRIESGKTPVLQLHQLAEFIARFRLPLHCSNPGLPTVVLKQVRAQMLRRGPSTGLRDKRIPYAYMKDFQPQGILPVWMKDQLTGRARLKCTSQKKSVKTT